MPPLNHEELEYLIDEIKDLQLTHGLTLKGTLEQSATRAAGRTTGISVVPTQYPRRFFTEAQRLQPLMNMLYMNAASDIDWLSSIITPLLPIDSLARALWTVHQGVKPLDRLVCGVFESEYMLHQDEDVRLKQIEMNTFAVTGTCHSQHAAALHHRLRHTYQTEQSQAQHKFFPSSETHGELLMNENVENVSKGLRLAHALYVQRMVKGEPCILMIVQDNSINVTDERPIEWAVQDAGVACFRCKWKDIMNLTVLTSDNVLLFCHLNTTVEVGVVYYRAGFEPEEYSEQGIKARIRLETSYAIKCPDILTHLATFTSVQAALTKTGALERFVGPDDAAKIRETFMYMQALDDTAEGIAAHKQTESQIAMEQYVLKPNLEASNMIVTGKQIARFIISVNKTPDKAKYVLMKMIKGPTSDGVLLREHMIFEGQVTSELGILGTCIWKRTVGSKEIDIISNEVAGWKFVSKPVDVRQASVLRGWGCLDSPALTEPTSETRA